MLKALREHLLEKPELYLDEMVVFLWDEFEVLVTTATISRALASIGWSKKTAHRVPKGRNADLRDFYLHNLSEFRPIILCMWMNLGVTSVLDLDEPASLL